MAEDKSRRKVAVIIIVVLLLIVLALLLSQCLPKKTTPVVRAPSTTNPALAADVATPAQTQPSTTAPAEVLTPATLTVQPNVAAGAAFAVDWTGPDNLGDFVTIVPIDAAATEYRSFQTTSQGKTLKLTAPVEPGAYEARYVTARSHTILGRSPIEVKATSATLDAPAEVLLGTTMSVSWTGPDNSGDYITIVPRDMPDDQYANYTNTSSGSPLSLTAPAESGTFELRYVTGQGHKVLARRPIQVSMPQVLLDAPSEAIAGSTIVVTWTGPDNSGDYVTVVPIETPDGQYGNYTVTSSGSPLNLRTPIEPGNAEIRYMTGQGGHVLARRAITVVAAKVTLSAPTEGTAGADVSITWIGPDNPGDYITIVSAGTPDGQYAAYANTSSGSPLSVTLPKQAGDAEIRYMSGQGGKVLARIPIKVVP